MYYLVQTAERANLLGQLGHQVTDLMRIAKIDVYNFDLTYVHGTYIMSGGREITHLPSTLVRLTSDTGLTGWGEVCPLGTTYLASHAGGARAARANSVTMIPRGANVAARGS